MKPTAINRSWSPWSIYSDKADTWIGASKDTHHRANRKAV